MKETKPALTVLEGARAKLLRVSPLGADTGEARRCYEILLSQVKTPELAACEVRSIMLACYNVLKTGLNPDPQFGHIYMIPRAGKANVQLGYQGLMELARRSGKVNNIRAELVYDNDDFEYETGLSVTLRHKPWWMTGGKTSGELRCAYVVWTNCIGTQVHVVPRVTLDRRREASQMKSSGAWAKYTDSMYLKTAIRDAARFWPLSPEMAHAIALDVAADEGLAQGTDDDMAEIIDAEPLKLEAAE
jgi:recombination protein RecT